MSPDELDGLGIIPLTSSGCLSLAVEGSSQLNPSLVWFRSDLRLEDNPALQAAIDRGGPVIPVFIRSPSDEGQWQSGEASDWWLHQSLSSLSTSLQKVGGRLVLRQGPSADVLHKLIQETGAAAVFWNRRYEPAVRESDSKVRASLEQAGIMTADFNSQLIFEPWDIATKEGRPYQVFTPYWRACLQKGLASTPIPAPEVIAAPEVWPDSVPLASFQLEPTRDWGTGLKGHWTPGCQGAAERLNEFLRSHVNQYAVDRDLPALVGTSRLSPHLHFGEISPRTIWHAVHQSLTGSPADQTGAETYLKEIGWREFAHHLLYHFPQTTDHPLRSEFADFPWEDNESGLKAWQRGRTGYPIVDAGMRELWKTGWMHNRVRMIVASFLVKDLRLHWGHGARWFWNTLVDADLANNTLGWQWSAGCGADAAPYFRVFNPVLQSQKFDPEGTYLAQWLPELAGLPPKWIHAPWTAPAEVLKFAGVSLGKTYPKPIVDHGEARDLALAAFQKIKRNV